MIMKANDRKVLETLKTKLSIDKYNDVIQLMKSFENKNNYKFVYTRTGKFNITDDYDYLPGIWNNEDTNIISIEIGIDEYFQFNY